MAELSVKTSPSSQLMGSETLSFDEETDTARMRFTAPESFVSPRGVVQGGLVCGFLDEVMGAPVFIKTGGEQAPLNLDINMTFIRPVPAGTLIGVGRIVKMGKRVVYLEGELFDEAGNLLARSTSTAMLTAI